MKIVTLDGPAMKHRQKIKSLLDGYRDALFYNFPGGLRFALSEGGSPLDEVLTALRKALVICEDIFKETDSVFVHMQKFAPSNRFALRHALRELGQAGLSIPPDRDIWLEQSSREDQNDEELEDFWINVAFGLPKSKLQNLLWCAVAYDFGLRPNPHCSIYLIDFVQEMIVHPYDDRGMDVIGRKKEALGRLFEAHKAWLLDYDIDAMNQTFLCRAQGPAGSKS